MSDLGEMLRLVAGNGRSAARKLVSLTREQKDNALRTAADLLLKEKDRLKAANEKDIAAGKEKGLPAPKLDRLRLDDKIIERLAEGLRQVAEMDDPIGEQISSSTRPNGLVVNRVRVPLGVVMIIFESRPNVTIEAASLCLKAGNATLLRGGSEAQHSNRALAEVLQDALEQSGLPKAAVQIVPTQDREAVSELLRMNDLIDLVIPRGGEGLIRSVTEQSLIPVIKHFNGICHVYVDEHADLEKAQALAVNAKLQRPATCNAAETLLVHRNVAQNYLPKTAQELMDKGCTLHVCPNSFQILCTYGESAFDANSIKRATEESFHTEYLSNDLSVRIVDSLDMALDHIEKFGSRHTDAIITENKENAEKFKVAVDSACVMHNASTRFSDGFEFGLGAEIGISTDKLHARGPMGVEGLTTYKWVCEGEGQIRS